MKWIFCFLCLISFVGYAQQPTIRQEFAPDRRTAWYDVSFQQGIAKGITTVPEAKKAFLDSLTQAGVSYLDSIRVLPDHVVGEKTVGYVLISVANLRALPQESSELSSQLLMGTQIRILDQVGNWLLVQSPDQYIGWTDPLGIVRMTPMEAHQYEQQPFGVMMAAQGFVHEKPTEKSQPLHDLSWGNKVIITQKRKKRGFTAIQLANGQTGWAKDIVPEIIWQKTWRATGEAVRQHAFSMMGIPYLWGGTSWKGVDCSGFTRMAYLSIGLLLPRDASQQVKEGTLITDQPTFEKLKIGDLLFFGRKLPNGQERVTHVAIWAGQNEFIHASGYVRVGSMDPQSPRYDAFNRGRFLRAHRYLSEVN